MRQKSHKMKNTTTKWVLGHKVTPYDTSADYDLLMGETPSMAQGPPPHFHNSYSEVFLVTEGEMEFMINGEIRVLKAGDSIDLPPKTLHTFGNKSNSTCKWVNIHSPKGFRSFFEELGIPATAENAFELSVAPEVIQRVMQTAQDYDMHIQL